MKVSLLVSVAALSACAVAQFEAEQCGPTGGYQICKRNQCCSQYGWCGTTAAYCRANLGCNPAFGRCTGVSSSTLRVSSTSRSSSIARLSTPSASPSPASTRIERCGPSYGGASCIGSIYGSCCSQYGWCGTTNGHCKTGCQSSFGTCSGTSSSSKSSSRTSTNTVRTSVATSSSRTTSRASSTSSASRSASSSVQSSSRTMASSTITSSVVASSSTLSASSSSSSVASSSASRASSSSTSLLASLSNTATVSSSSSAGVSSSSSAVVSSSSSAVLSSSSSAISSSSSATIPSSTSAVASSSASQSVSSSSISGSSISSSASLSASAVSSSLVATPSASGSPVWLPSRNPDIDRTSPDRLIPSNILSFYYVEQIPGTLSKLEVVTLTNDAKGVLLEDISTIDSITCSGSSVSITFTDNAAANDALTWPTGTLLFTAVEGCNAANERGVYLVNNEIGSRSLRKKQLTRRLLRFPATRKTLAEYIVALTEYIKQLLATASSTSSIVAPTPTPSAVLSSSFCLKVITPGVSSSGWLVKQSSVDNNGNFQLDPAIGGIVANVARFALDDQNKLIVNTPGLANIKETGHSRGTGAMFRFGDPYAGSNPTHCSIKTDVAGYLGQQVLKCTGGFITAPVRTFTGFRHYSKLIAGLTHLFATDDLVTSEDGNFVIDLGLFTGGDCPDTLPVSSSDPVATPSSTSVLSLATTDAISTPSVSASSDLPMSSSSAIPSTTTVPTSVATPPPSIEVPSSFCLKVLTPGVHSSDWVVKQSNPAAGNGAFFLDPVVGGKYESVAVFSLGEQGLMKVVTPGTVGYMITRYSRGTGGMFRFSPLSTSLPSNLCSVQTDVAGYLGQQVLKCIGSLTSPSQTFTGFRDQVGINGNGLDYLFGTFDFTTNTATSFLIELGLFTGGSCPDVPSPNPIEISTTLSSPISESTSISSSIPSTTPV